MAEGRMLKKEISDSKKLGRLKSDRARVLYFMMLPHLDRDGRLKADPDQIKGRICTKLPYSTKSIQTALEQLHDVGLLVLYDINGDQCVQYTRFNDFQSFNYDRESESKILPPTPDNSRPTPNNSPLKEEKFKRREEKIKEKYSSDFENFWKTFKGRYNPDTGKYIKGGKMEAFIEWQKLSEDEKSKATNAAPLTGSKITKDAFRWLKYKRWEDFEVPKQKANDDQAAIEKQKQKVRDEDGQYYREKTTEELQKMLVSKGSAHIFRRWLIKEILDERTD